MFFYNGARASYHNGVPYTSEVLYLEQILAGWQQDVAHVFANKYPQSPCTILSRACANANSKPSCPSWITGLEPGCTHAVGIYCIHIYSCMCSSRRRGLDARAESAREREKRTRDKSGQAIRRIVRPAKARKSSVAYTLAQCNARFRFARRHTLSIRNFYFARLDRAVFLYNFRLLRNVQRPYVAPAVCPCSVILRIDRNTKRVSILTRKTRVIQKLMIENCYLVTRGCIMPLQ